MDTNEDFITSTIEQVDEYLKMEKRELWQLAATEEGEEWLLSQPEWTPAEQADYKQLMDRDDDEYWSTHCVRHGSELVGPDRHCVECAGELADERVSDL